MIDRWRRWRLAWWTRILYARERRLEAFEANPFDTHFSLRHCVRERYRNAVSRARYKFDLLNSPTSNLPKAKVRL